MQPLPCFPLAWIGGGGTFIGGTATGEDAADCGAATEGCTVGLDASGTLVSPTIFEDAAGGCAGGGTCGWLVTGVACAPHLLQNALPGAIGLPQLTQNREAGLAGWVCGAPQELQKRVPSLSAAPQRLQIVLIVSYSVRLTWRSLNVA